MPNYSGKHKFYKDIHFNRKVLFLSNMALMAASIIPSNRITILLQTYSISKVKKEIMEGKWRKQVNWFEKRLDIIKPT